jgi:hypothetical protein
VEGFSHEVCLRKGESGAVADCGVHTTVGIAAIDTLNSGCGIKFVHLLYNFNDSFFVILRMQKYKKNTIWENKFCHIAQKVYFCILK